MRLDTANYFSISFKAFPLFVLLLIIAQSCQKKGDVLENELPDTFLVYESINLTGENRLNSQVKLSWYGTDVDGFITGYEISTDNINWSLTTKQDSTFQFTLTGGSDTLDLDFYIRAIDNQGAKDETPAYLKIPLKNTPPEISLVEAAEPGDTVFLVSSFQYTASDRDGNESITKIEVKINNGNWVEIDRSSNIITLLPSNAKAVGTSTAKLIVNERESATLATNLQMDGLNTIYIRATDEAGAISVEDTSKTFFLRNQKADILMISGQSPTIAQNYISALNNQSIAFDFLDFTSNAAANQPVFWNPTFGLMLSNYKILIINSSGAQFSNPLTGQTGGILEFGAQGIQEFVNITGKKYIISTRFTTTTDLNPLIGVLPVAQLVTSPGQVRVAANDSLLPQNPAYPALTCKNVILGPNPFVPSIDAQPLYRAQLTKINGWAGDNIVGVSRSVNVGGVQRINQIFFSIQLHDFNNDLNAFEAFFNQAINNDFNW